MSHRMRYVLAFALGALTNHYTLGSQGPLLPHEWSWVTYVIPVLIFVTAWVWLRHDMRKERKDDHA